MIGYVKQALTVLAAALAGYVLGVYTVISRLPESTWFAEPPEWVLAVEGVYIAAAGGATVCLFAWIYVDYRYEVNNA